MGKRAALVLVLLFSPLLVAIALVMLVTWTATAAVLHCFALVAWIFTGRRVLFVYSDSPVWKGHIEAEVLPRLPATASVLNWSARSKWPFWSLSVWLFRFHGGSREFNPLGMVFRPFRPMRLFRFWKPFRDFKHGKAEPLRSLEAEFFQCVSDRAD